MRNSDSRIAVVGTGAMGSIYAALLAAAGNEVWAVDVWREHVEAMRQRGLRVHGASGDRTVEVHAAGDLAGVPPVDVAIVATKSYDLPVVARAIVTAAGSGALVGDETLVVTIQNGLGNAERLCDALAAAGPAGEAISRRVLVGVAFGFGATVESPGSAVHRGMGVIRLGELDGTLTPRLERLTELWAGAGFNVRAFEDIRLLIWEKFVCNVTINGPCAAFRRRVGELMDDADTWPVALACGLEAHRVGVAMGVPFSFDDAETFITEFCHRVREHAPSTMQDFLAGRPTEIDAINGAVTPLAREHGLEAPTNEVIAAIVRAGRQRTGR